MDRVSKLSEMLTGTAMTLDQRALNERIARACGMKDDDPVWTVLVVLGHYERLYEAVPERIREAAIAETLAVRESLDAHLAREQAAISARLAAGIEGIVTASLRDGVRMRLTSAIVLAAVLILTVGVCGYVAGAWAGRTDAYAEAIERFAWVHTEAGGAATMLTKTGVIAGIVTCQHEGSTFTITGDRTATCSRPGRRGAKITSSMQVPAL